MCHYNRKGGILRKGHRRLEGGRELERRRVSSSRCGMDKAELVRVRGFRGCCG